MLNKILDGLKKTSMKWYLKIYRFMMEQVYRCHLDHYVYFNKLDNKRYILLLLYVDEMIVAGSNVGYKCSQNKIS